MNTNGTVKVIVPGRGRIPRIGGLGPKMIPTDITFETLEVIATTRGAAQCAVLDGNGGSHPVTRQNYRDIFATYSTTAPKEAAANETPAPKKEDKVEVEESLAPEDAVDVVSHTEEAAPEEKNDASVEESKDEAGEEKSEETAAPEKGDELKVVNKNKNNNHGGKKKNNNHN